jgi:hypothetical protein
MYIRIHQEWHAAQNNSNNNKPAFLVDPDSLRFNLDFCIAFFGRLAATAPRWLLDSNSNNNNNNRTTNGTTTTATMAQGDDDVAALSSLSRLHNYVAAGYLPQPFKFEVISNGDSRVVVNSSDDYSDEEEDDDQHDDDDVDYSISDQDEFNDDESIDNVNSVLVRLLLGKAGSEDFYSYELWQTKGESIRKARRKLADMALGDLMGNDDDVNIVSDNELEDESDLDGDDMIESDDGFLTPGTTSYDWEIRQVVEGKVDKYLYGILWNLQTYQDGLCPNYGFSYGKHMSPMASEIVEFFQAARDQNQIVGPHELKALVKDNQGGDKSQGGFCGPSISAGLSCLAALPSAVKNELVPEPYCWISDESVEDIYSSCMSPIDNTFDMAKFAQLCEEQVKALQCMGLRSTKHQAQESHDDRRIMVNDHSWTVISKAPKPLNHPFDPPPPFSEKLSRLRPNNRIRISHYMATAEPRPRSIWNDQKPRAATTSIATISSHRGFVDKESHEIIHSDPGAFLSKYEIDQVPYKIAYQHERQEKGRQQRTAKMTFHSSNNPPTIVSNGKIGGSTTPTVFNMQNGQSARPQPPHVDMDVDRLARMKIFRIKPPPLQPSKTSDGVTALACLKQLQDAGLIGSVEWTTNTRIVMNLIRSLSSDNDKALQSTSSKTNNEYKTCDGSKTGVLIPSRAKSCNSIWHLLLYVLLFPRIGLNKAFAT